MKRFRGSRSLVYTVLGLLALTALVYAQEPARFERGINLIQGNLVISRGSFIPTSGDLSYAEMVRIETDSNVTYTASQIRFGYILRESITSNRTDALPTAANIVAQFPGSHVGSALWLVVDNQDDASTITLNGASTGVTYAGGCGTALAASEAASVLIMFMNVTSGSEAVRAVCHIN